MNDNDRFLYYNATDSAVTFQCRNEFWHELSDGYDYTYNQTIRLFEPLMFMQTRGLRVKKDAIEETSLQISRDLEEKRQELNRLAGREINANSPKDVAQYFYIEKGHPPFTNKDGNITTDDSAMQRLAKPTAKRAGFKEAKLVQDIRGLVKLQSSYLDVPVDSDGRLRCSWNPRGTKFGRLSSSESIFGTGMNLQNLHPLYKKFIYADEGYFFVEVDKRQAEWVLMAYITQDANMLKVVEENRDPHVYTGSMIFNLPEDIIKHDNKVVGHETDRDRILEMRMEDDVLKELVSILPSMMSGRQVGKHGNHGLNYDEGYRRFSLMWELEESFGKFVVEKYHKVYPGIRKWYKAIQQQLATNRTLINCFGRKMKFMDQWSDELFKQAYSALAQSTQVDGLNLGLCQIYEHPKLCASNSVNMDLMAQVHDSILMQFPISVLSPYESFGGIMADIYDLVSPEMEYHGRKFKIATDMKVGINWGAYHKEHNPEGMQEVDPSHGDVEEKVRELLGVSA